MKYDRGANSTTIGESDRRSVRRRPPVSGATARRRNAPAQPAHRRVGPLPADHGFDDSNTAGKRQ